MKTMLLRGLVPSGLLVLCLINTVFAPAVFAQAPPHSMTPPGNIHPRLVPQRPALPPPLVTGAAVVTDQGDYAPGATAHIRGQVFQAGETVRLQVLHADGTSDGGQDHQPWTVVADADGGFHATWHVCEDDCVGSALTLTAVGVVSGRTALANFTDAPTAPTYQELKAFGSPSPGGYPQGGLIKGTDGKLYGTAASGGTLGGGTVFKLSTDGTGFTVLKNFNDSTGLSPRSALLQGSDGALYGTTYYSGPLGAGTVFKLNTDGTGFTILKNFDWSTTGGYLESRLIQGTDGVLYGTAKMGGAGSYGTIFKLNTDGTGFSILKQFGDGTEGGTLIAGLIQGTDGALYGMAQTGGTGGYGTVFKLNTDGSGFTVLKGDFDYYAASGGYLSSGLLQGTDGVLYGATQQGGTGGYGSVFKLNTDGTGFTVLASFDYVTTGGFLYSGLLQGADGALYSMTGYGGSDNVGTVFKVNTDASGFQVIKQLDYATSGGVPVSSKLIQGTDGTLYGVAAQGGSTGSGTVFKLNTDGTGFVVIKNLAVSADISVDGGTPQGGVIQGTDGAIYGTASGGGTNGAGTVFKLNTDGSGFNILKSDFDYSTTGSYLFAPVIQGTDGALYGIATSGGSEGNGTVFKLNPDGSAFSVVRSLTSSETGALPFGDLIQGSDGALYGTTSHGGSSGSGTVFKLNSDGTGSTILKSFGRPSIGASPVGRLIQGTDGALYGTAQQGGTYGYGTVFRLNTDGTGSTLLKNFDYFTTGGYPQGELVQGSDGALYGTTSVGGSGGYGTVFKLNTDGTGFAVLKNFDYFTTTGGTLYSGLIQGTDGALYGTALQGGSGGNGTVFKLNTDGTGFSVLKGFFDLDAAGFLYSGLIQGTDGALYGTTLSGGSGGYGTVFKLNPDGSAFSVVGSLTYYETGALPYGDLIQGSDGALYGTTFAGGSGGYGTVFKLNTDGTGFTVLKDFDNSTTGGYIKSALIEGTDGALYGTALQGGSSGYGTVFKLNKDGTGFTVLAPFDYAVTGGYLYSGLMQGADGVLYSSATYGGINGGGTVFKLNTDGTGFGVVKNLGTSPDLSEDGGSPRAGLLRGTDGALYGTTQQGGNYDYGTVFGLNPDGTGFRVLKHLDAVTTGGDPESPLMQGIDGALYGTAPLGGSYGGGTVFKLNTDGTGFSVLQNLDYYTTGGYPDSGLVQRTDGTLYGTAGYGGNFGAGTVFQLGPDGSDFSVVKNFDYASNGFAPHGRLTKGTDGNLYGTTSQGGNGAGTVYRLTFGGCAGAVDGTACDDGNACTQTDTCQAGTCTGASPVVCAALDQCHTAGTCDTGTGTCSNPTKSDGTSCNDGNACTQADTCQSGTCAGASPVVCAASDQCHTAGTCNTGTGVCSNPAKANGTSCNDGSSCTQTDTCQAGVCTGGNYSWSSVLQPINAIAPMSVFKLGSTIPTKFQLTGACSSNTSLLATIYLYKLTDAEGPVNEATSVSAADTGTTFRYAGGQYIFNLGTKGLSEGTWNLGIDLHDGVGIRVVAIGLRK